MWEWTVIRCRRTRSGSVGSIMRIATSASRMARSSRSSDVSRVMLDLGIEVVEGGDPGRVSQAEAKATVVVIFSGPLGRSRESVICASVIASLAETSRTVR